MNHVVSVAIPRPIDHLFTYRIPPELVAEVQPEQWIGRWVKVPFGKSVTHAYVAESPQLEEEQNLKNLKSILEVGQESTTIPEEVLQLCRWAHEYYQAPLGEVLLSAAPPAALGLRSGEKKRKNKWLEKNSFSIERSIVLTHDQKDAVEKIKSFPESSVTLIRGITGSGKTEVYIDLARETLTQNKSVLILLPEIALTPQLHSRFQKSLGVNVGLWHSAVSEAQRRDQWEALRMGALRVLVGARSAVFAPIKDLGLIVIDEEHDSTYKQEDRFRYHARDLAIVRSKFSKARVVLGSATPCLETLENVKNSRYFEVRLDHRVAGGELPGVEILDLSKEKLISGTQSLLAERAIQKIKHTLLQGQQVMVFLNRRGFAAFFLCEECKYVVGCPHCSISLTYHKRTQQLKCHMCGYSQVPPHACPQCKGFNLKKVGAGTESLEEELCRLIPEIKIQRLDRDQITSNTRLEEVLENFREGKANVLLGTQMLVKGHDFPNVTLVVVILADALFRWPDFRASEKAYQVLTQVAGRAGRGTQKGNVIIQTFDPNHLVLQTLIGKYTEAQFLEQERELRKVLAYPPFTRIARLRLEATQSKEAALRAQKIYEEIKGVEGVEILGPSEAFIEKTKDFYRWDLLVKAFQIQALQKVIKIAKKRASFSKWSLLVDVDPQSVA